MRVSEVFAMGGGSGYDSGNNGGPVFKGNRFTARYYRERLFFKEGSDDTRFNGGFRNQSFTGGKDLTGVLG